MTHPVDFPQEFPRWELKPGVKPHVILLGRGEWACGIKLSRPIRGNTALRIRGTAVGNSPSDALRKYLAGETYHPWEPSTKYSAWPTSTVSTPEYQQEQREKNQRARDLLDGLARKGAE